jgi:hypothetical protein
VSDYLIRRSFDGSADVWPALSRQGYALTDDRELGLPADLAETFRQKYFRAPPLRHDDGDWPVDRLRARDVIRYQRHDGGLELREHESITITDRAGIPGKREHARVLLLGDPQAEELLRALLQLVPPGRCKPNGTFGVNLLRTFTNVVTRPHHDREEYIIIYVLRRVGGGAVTYLYQPDDVPDSGEPLADPVLRRQLNPGDIIIFEDQLFKHGATPLEKPVNGSAMRDALVCTVDYQETYLAAV